MSSVMKKFFAGLALAATTSLPVTAQAADAERLAGVARRGTDVMPFDIKATTHLFTKTDRGGVQRVVTRNSSDAVQVELVRKHLHAIQAQFLKGDFSGPSHIHGQDMPGLAQLNAAKAGEIKMTYRDVPAGAQVTYSTQLPELVAALHAWFDAQLADHGSDAMAGHHHPGAHRAN